MPANLFFPFNLFQISTKKQTAFAADDDMGNDRNQIPVFPRNGRYHFIYFRNIRNLPDFKRNKKEKRRECDLISYTLSFAIFSRLWHKIKSMCQPSPSPLKPASHMLYFSQTLSHVCHIKKRRQ